MEAVETSVPALDPAAPLSGTMEKEWPHIVSALSLSPQQARIVELILQGKADKQIARDMNVRLPTVRTYLTRIFQRTGSADRVALVLRVFACAREWREQTGGGR